MLADTRVSEYRMRVCESCEHYVRMTKTCGTLGVGKKVGDAKLCGCVMPIKTRIEASRCPIGRWNRGCSDVDFERAREFAHEIRAKKKLTSQEIKELTALLSSVSGRKRGVTMCAPCLVEMRKELDTILKNAL